MEKAVSAEMITLPAATPAAMTKLLKSFGPRSAVVQAVLMLTQKSLPGSSDIGTSLTSFRLCEAATATMTNGATQNTKPANKIRCVKKLRIGVRSTMAASAVMHAPLDEAELDDGQYDDEQHQDDALSGGARIIETSEAVRIDLVDHQIGGVGRTAGGHDVDDAEGVLEAFGDVDDKQEEDRRRDQWKLDVPEAPHDAGPVHRGRLDQRTWYRLQRGQEEDEIIADIFPGERNDDRGHGVGAVEAGVPEDRPELVDGSHETGFRRQDEAERQRQRRCCYAVWPDQHDAVDT